MTSSVPAAPDDAPRLPPGRAVIVWGNCQAAPVAKLLTDVVAAAGAEVVLVPPVFEITEHGLAHVQSLVREAAALVTQPVRDEYRWPGCGADQLAALLPADALLVRFPVMYDSGPFPYACNAHGGDGARVDAPLTDYHDLRAIVAARRGFGIDESLRWWPRPEPAVVRANAAGSRAELARRDAGLDVTGADLLGPGAMFTLSHPTNRVLAAVARRVLDRLGTPADVIAPDREFLGERRAPVETAVVEALDWAGEEVHSDWQLRGELVPLRRVLAAQLAFYADRPDVVTDSCRRYADRLSRLGLGEA